MAAAARSEIEESLRTGLASTDDADPHAAQTTGLAQEFADMKLLVAQMGLRLRRYLRLDSHADHDVVGGHCRRAGLDVEHVGVLDRAHLVAENDVLVLPAGPLHVVAKLLPRDRVELGVQEMVDAAELMEVSQEGVGVGRL